MAVAGCAGDLQIASTRTNEDRESGEEQQRSFSVRQLRGAPVIGLLLAGTSVLLSGCQIIAGISDRSSRGGPKEPPPCSADSECRSDGEDAAELPGLGQSGVADGGRKDALAGTSIAAGGTLRESSCGKRYMAGDVGRFDVYIMMNRSGSMVLPFDLWTPIGTAIGDFVAMPEAAGIAVGIQFFENRNASCEVADYATPAVPLGLLPGNAPAIRTAISENGPEFGGTPTVPALRGAIEHAQGWTSQSGARTIILLATDGNTEECDSTLENVLLSAAEGVVGSPSIPTYVVGIGNMSAMNQIAAAGGTEEALIIDPNGDSGRQLFEWMNGLRAGAPSCDLPITLDVLDLDRVEVRLVTSGSESAVPRIPDWLAERPGQAAAVFRERFVAGN